MDFILLIALFKIGNYVRSLKSDKCLLPLQKRGLLSTFVNTFKHISRGISVISLHSLNCSSVSG